MKWWKLRKKWEEKQGETVEECTWLEKKRKGKVGKERKVLKI